MFAAFIKVSSPNVLSSGGGKMQRRLFSSFHGVGLSGCAGPETEETFALEIHSSFEFDVFVLRRFLSFSLTECSFPDQCPGFLPHKASTIIYWFLSYRENGWLRLGVQEDPESLREGVKNHFTESGAHPPPPFADFLYHFQTRVFPGKYLGGR